MIKSSLVGGYENFIHVCNMLVRIPKSIGIPTIYLVRNAEPSIFSSHLVGFLEEAPREMNYSTNTLTDGNQIINISRMGKMKV
jgi:hypothetical protein